MYRYVVRVPRLGVRCATRGFTDLLTVPLTHESTTQLVMLKSNELLRILKMTQDDLLKLNDEDYNDLKIMVSRLPSIDATLFDKLSNGILSAKFYNIDTKLLALILDLIESKGSTELLLLVVKQFSESLETDLSLEVKQRFYEAWAIHTDELIQDQFLTTYLNSKNPIVSNLLIQTSMLRQDYEQAFQTAKSCLQSTEELDRYTVELLAYHLMELGDIDSVFEMIEMIHKKKKHLFYHKYLPLSNNQMGRLISAALLSDRYAMAKTLFNKYCYYQILHYLDQGTLLYFAKMAALRLDQRQLLSICFLLENSGHLSESIRTAVAIYKFELKLYKTKPKKLSLPKEFQDLGKLDTISLSDFPVFRKRLIESYPSQDNIILVLQQTLGEDSHTHEKGARLLLNIFLSALSEVGDPEMMLGLLGRLYKEVESESSLLDQDSIFYIIRSYEKSQQRLNEKSALFIRNLLLRDADFKFTSKTYRLVNKIFRDKYDGDKSFVTPLLDRYKTRYHHPREAVE